MLLILLISTFILMMVISPTVALTATLNGAKLFFFNVFPALFMFSILCNLIVSLGGIELYSKLFGGMLCKPLRLSRKCATAIIISILCGYPLGTKYSGDLYRIGDINFKTFKRLVILASTPSPIFVIGSIGVLMLKNVTLGYILLISSYISAFILSFILKTDKSRNIINVNNISREKLPFSKCFLNSVEQSISTVLMVGGFIIFFNVLCTFLDNLVFSKLHFSLVGGILAGILEMTNGCKIISTSAIPMQFIISIIAFFLTFGGLSILSQCYSFIYDLKISFLYFVKYKILFGVINSVVAFAIYNLFTYITACTF